MQKVVINKGFQTFDLSAGEKFNALFFSHLALSFGISADGRFFFEIDTPIIMT